MLTIELTPEADRGARITARDPEDTEVMVLVSAEKVCSLDEQLKSQRNSIMERRARKEDYRRLGARLFDFLFVEKVRKHYIALCERARARDVPLHIRLVLEQCWQPYPWELLYDEDSQEFLATAPSKGLYRLIRPETLPNQPRPALDATIVTASPPELPPLDLPDELRKLQQALAAAGEAAPQLTVHHQITRSTLNEVLASERPGLLHFSGHGDYFERDREGGLALHDEGGELAWVRERELAEILRGHECLGLVVLNACEGARSDDARPFSGVGPRLVEARVPAVVAMQYMVRDRSAAIFSSAFYASLARGEDVAMAIQAARKQLLAECTDDPRDVFAPVLYMRGTPLRLRPPTSGEKRVAPTVDPQARAAAVAEYKRARAEERRTRLLDLRGLAGIDRGSHQTELNLHDLAVTPALHGETDEFRARLTALQGRLRERDLAPAERRAVESQIKQLEDQRWDHHGGAPGRSVEPLSLAKALHLYPRFTVIGDPGAGKSVLLNLVLLACMEGDVGLWARQLLLGDDPFSKEALQALEALQELLPVRLLLGGFGRALEAEEGLSLEEFIRRQLDAERAPPALRDCLGELLEAGQVFLLCDALDEAPERLRGLVVERLSALLEQYPRVRLLLTSRPYGYRPRVPGLEHTRLAPLHHRQQRSLVSRLHRLAETHRGDHARHVDRARRRTDSLLQAIRSQPDWGRLISNPLLLTLSALAPDDGRGLPKHPVVIFKRFVETILVAWRSAAHLSPEGERRLMDAWSTVAFKLVRGERRDVFTRTHLQRLLEDALSGGAAPISAESALDLALEKGLIAMEGEDVLRFWHSALAEFLAARSLTGNGRGAAQRVLDEPALPPLVLQLAAAWLEYECEYPEELEALAEGLLARDRRGAGQLFRPGLRAVSDCMVYGVHFSSNLTLRVWTEWAQLLEQMPPSLLWRDFSQFASSVKLPRLTAQLLERFCLVNDRGIEEVQEGLARVAALGGSRGAAAQAVYGRWLVQRVGRQTKIYGAFGLAASGQWIDTVIDVLGRFGGTQELEPESVASLVQQGGPELLERLRTMVRESPSSEERKLEDRRLSAACLLAVAGRWDDDVASVLRRTLEQSGIYRVDDVKAVLRRCAGDGRVSEALLEWISEPSSLGEYARQVVGEVAPVMEGMPEAVLEKTATAEGELLGKLEHLLASIGEERRTLADTLRRWLGEPQQERRMRAARILHRLAPRDERLYQALREGMQYTDERVRARWAHLVLEIARDLSDSAMEALLACARSPEQEVRKVVYEGLFRRMSGLWPKWLERWLGCAADSSVPAAARLDAALFVEYVPETRERIVQSLRELLGAEEGAVRRGAALELLRQEEFDERTVVVAAEEMAQTFDSNDAREFRLWMRMSKVPFAAAALRAVLRALPEEANPPLEQIDARLWAFDNLLKRLAVADPACLVLLLDALEHQGLIGLLAARTVSGLVDSHPPMLEAFRERMERAMRGSNRRELISLLQPLLWSDKLAPLVTETIRAIEPEGLPQSTLAWLARHVDSKEARGDAIRLWRLVLEGEDMDLLLEAAVTLSYLAPEDSGAWVQPAVARVLSSPEPSQRVDAGLLALWHGLLEDQAIAVLLDCLELTDQPYESQTGALYLLKHERPRASSGRTHDMEIQEQIWPAQQIDLTAMESLCVLCPEIGLKRLVGWLHGSDMRRLMIAAKCLATRIEYREVVRSALVRRLGSDPLEQFVWFEPLIAEHDLYSADMTEQVLSRLLAGKPPDMWTIDRLAQWLRWHPDGLSVVRAHGLARYDVSAQLLYQLPASLELVSFAIDVALTQARARDYNEHDGAVGALQRLCQAEDEEDKREKAPPADPSEVRRWLREALAEHTGADELAVMLTYDQLAEIGEVPLEQRAESLRRALAADVAAAEPDLQMYQLSLQVLAVFRLQKMGAHDDRMLPVLERAVRIPWVGHYGWRLDIGRAVLALRPADAELRRFLVQTALEPYLWGSIAEVLELLAEVGLSVDERVEVLIARLGVGVRPEWLGDLAAGAIRMETTPAVIGALKGLGLAPERLDDLLHQMTFTHAAQLDARTKLKLVRRAASPVLAARLLLSVIAEGTEIKSAAEQWYARYAAEGKQMKSEDDRWSYRALESIALRLHLLDKLSSAGDPARMQEIFIELASAPTEWHVHLYSRACAGDVLSDAEWGELVAWLTASPEERPEGVLAKEWVLLGLWKQVEPHRAGALLRS